MGFDRGAGKPDHLRYGTRNYLAVISTVNCSASTSKYITERVRELGLLKDYPNVDGVMAIVHRQGCAMQFDGPDHKQLDRTLAGFARHPNVAAYILVGLGCEIVQASHLIDNEHLALIQLNGQAKAPLALSIQECGGIGKTVEAGVKAVAEMLPRVNDVKRVQLRRSTSSSAPTAAAPTATAASPPTRPSASPAICWFNRAARACWARRRRFTARSTS